MEGLVKTEGMGWLLTRFAPAPWDTIVRDMWGVTNTEDARWIADSARAHAGSPFQGSGAPHQPCRRSAPACLCAMPAVSKRPLRPACRDGAADRALELSGAGGAPSSGRHHARAGGRTTAGPSRPDLTTRGEYRSCGSRRPRRSSVSAATDAVACARQSPKLSPAAWPSRPYRFEASTAARHSASPKGTIVMPSSRESSVIVRPGRIRGARLLRCGSAAGPADRLVWSARPCSRGT